MRFSFWTIIALGGNQSRVAGACMGCINSVKHVLQKEQELNGDGKNDKSDEQDDETDGTASLSSSSSQDDSDVPALKSNHGREETFIFQPIPPLEIYYDANKEQKLGEKM